MFELEHYSYDFHKFVSFINCSFHHALVVDFDPIVGSMPGFYIAEFRKIRTRLPPKETSKGPHKANSY